MAETQAEAIREITETRLSSIDPANPPSPERIQADIINDTTVAFQLENQNRSNGNKWNIPKALFPVQIAKILLWLYPIVKLAPAGLEESRDYDVLAVYMSDGEDEGLYVADEDEIKRLIRMYDFTIKGTAVKEVIDILNVEAPRRTRCADPDLIAVNNGIFDYRAKILMPFSPQYIFTAKSRVNYDPNAQNVIIRNSDGTTWDVESWMEELASHDPELVQLLWELIGACLRPNVPWNKTAWFISETGNNGKGTLCALIRNTLGKGAYTSISLAEFGKEFMLESLFKVNAVITDENPVGIYLDDVANLKAIITGDVVLANRKYKTPVAIRFHGFIIECVNEMPRVRDRSTSFRRRLLPVPFTQCFTGRERKYIKADYLQRDSVLEYVLHKVLNMDYYELSEPLVCKNMLDDFQLVNDPVSQFVAEMLPKCVWDFIPFSFLYDLYRAWLQKYYPNSPALNRPTFIKELRSLLASSPVWSIPDGTRHPGGRMNEPELLIAEYDLRDWMNPLYRGIDEKKKCHPQLPKGGMRGIERK